MIGTVRKSLLSTAALAAVVTGAVAPSSAVAASKPSLVFLTAKQVPTSKYYSKWQETKVITGLRTSDPYCWQKPFPKKTVKFRAIFNDQQGNVINQLAVKASSESAAKKLVKDVKKCWPAKPPQGGGEEAKTKVSAKHYGKFSVKSGLWIGQQSWCGGNSPDSVQMWAIGRNGREVTYLHFWPGRKSCSAPKDMWVSLSKKALNQL